MEAPPQSRSRPRKRQRVTEGGNTANPAPGSSVTGHNQGWGPAVTHATHVVSIAPVAHPQAVRAHNDTVLGQPPTFPSQHLERSHHHQQVVAGPDGLMNGYSAPSQHSHSQYPDQTSALNAPQPSDLSGLSNLSSLGDGSATNNLHQQHSLSQHQHATHQQQLAQQQHQQQHPFAQQHLSQTLSQQQQQPNHQQHNPQPQQLSQQPQASQQPAQEQQPQQRPSGASSSKKDSGLFQQYGANNAGSDASPTAVANSPATFGNTVWPVTTSAPSPPPPASTASVSMPPPSNTTGLAPPPEGIYRSFEDLLASVQKVAKDQGYGVVKLRASNYRDSKPTRYDLVCDRGGVKYNSTAKKRNPSTRKVDCPFRAKAVCEVNLGNQWRFVVQDGRHNHEARIPAAVPGQESTPVAQGLRSATNKIDRLSHDTATGINRLEAQLDAFANAVFTRLGNIEKRLDAIENGRPTMLGGNGVPSMTTPSMPPANMGGGLGNGPMTNGGLGANAMVDHQHRLSNMDRVAGLDRSGIGGLDQRGLGGMEQRGMELGMELSEGLMPPIGPS